MNMASWENPTISQIISQKTLSHPMFLFRIPIVEHQIQKNICSTATYNEQSTQPTIIWYHLVFINWIISYLIISFFYTW